MDSNPSASSPPSLRRRLLGQMKHVGASLLPHALLVRRGNTRGRRIALTFDDGPDAMTPVYLDLLDRLGVRATFFVVGRACAENRAALLDTIARGHEVAGHGFTHRRFTKLSALELRDELAQTAALLPPPQARRALLRPPHGTTSLATLARCARAGYTTVLWSCDSLDARTSSADEVAAALVPERVSPGDIVLLHEGQQWTLDALPRVVDGLRGAGYDLVTVGDLL
ncbi:MAG TPA: polysaccharide deacetylase family protein [Polyangia bacterium]|nr:polysaccharide deacetylase family protein [Polyangia bacterium]